MQQPNAEFAEVTQSSQSFSFIEFPLRPLRFLCELCVRLFQAAFATCGFRATTIARDAHSLLRARPHRIQNRAFVQSKTEMLFLVLI
jgi:hypothetical protein